FVSVLPDAEALVDGCGPDCCWVEDVAPCVVLDDDVPPLAPPVPEDWLVVAPCEIDEGEFEVVALWLALAPLETLWSPLPTFTPGLMFAPALTSVLLMPTFAFTSTFGFTLSRLPDDEDDVVGDIEPDVVDEVWPLVPPWSMFDVEFVLLDVWLA